jgi:hypothetical protein
MKYVLLALKYLPSVLAGVQAVEGSIQAPGQTKKALVLGAIQAAASVGESVPEDHVQLISGLIDTTVGGLNAAGVFKKA